MGILFPGGDVGTGEKNKQSERSHQCCVHVIGTQHLLLYGTYLFFFISACDENCLA